MANYQTPPTVTGPDLLTSAAWNTYVRDNLEVVGRPPSVSVRLTADRAWTGPPDRIPWDEAEWQTDSMWDAADSEYINITADGWYLIMGEMRFGTSTAGPVDYLYAQVSIDPSPTSCLSIASPDIFYGNTFTSYSAARYTYRYLTTTDRLYMLAGTCDLLAESRMTIAWAYA